MSVFDAERWTGLSFFKCVCQLDWQSEHFCMCLCVCIFPFPLLPLNKSSATELFIGSRFLQR